MHQRLPYTKAQFRCANDACSNATQASPDKDLLLALQIIAARHVLLEGLCAHPAALRGVERWYRAIGEGRGKPDQLIEVSSPAPNQSESCPEEAPTIAKDKKHISQCARDIADAARRLETSLAVSPGAASPGRIELVNSLAGLRPRDRHLITLAMAYGAVSCDHAHGKTFAVVCKELEQARTKLIANNGAWCERLARNYAKQGIDISDLAQEGRMGLINAIDRFDPQYDVRFSSFAVIRIRKAMARAIYDQSRTIRLPVHIHEWFGTVRKVKESLASRGRMATPEAIRTITGLTAERVKAIEEVPSSSSLTMPSRKDDPWHRGPNDDPWHREQNEIDIEDKNAINQEQYLMAKEKNIFIEKMLDRLPDAHKKLLQTRFGLQDGNEQTIEETAERFGLSNEAARSLEIRALKTLKRLFLVSGRDHVGSLAASSQEIDVTITGNACLEWKNQEFQSYFKERWNEGLSHKRIGEELKTVTGLTFSKTVIDNRARLLGLEPRRAPARPKQIPY